MLPPVFLDSDVVISSLISKTGAAYFLIHETGTALNISNVSVEELTEVVERMGLDRRELKETVNKFRVVDIGDATAKLKTTYAAYVTDQDDAHVVAGAIAADVGFLVTYNTRHFNVGKIKADFKIIVVTPAQFLQYLRSK